MDGNKNISHSEPLILTTVFTKNYNTQGNQDFVTSINNVGAAAVVKTSFDIKSCRKSPVIMGMRMKSMKSPVEK